MDGHNAAIQAQLFSPLQRLNVHTQAHLGAGRDGWVDLFALGLIQNLGHAFSSLGWLRLFNFSNWFIRVHVLVVLGFADPASGKLTRSHHHLWVAAFDWLVVIGKRQDWG